MCFLSSLPCRLPPHKHPSVQGGRAYHRPQSCGDGRKSFLLLACSSAHRGSPLSEAHEVHFRIKIISQLCYTPQYMHVYIYLSRFLKPYMLLQIPKYYFYFAPYRHNRGATCRVSPGSRSRQSWSTALHGNPWIPRDSPEWNNGRQQRHQRTINTDT